MKFFVLTLLSQLLVVSLCLPSFASDNHAAHAEHDHHDHDAKADSPHGHAHEDRRIGPQKGVVAASDAEGFRLHPAAEKNFDLATLSLSNDRTVRIPRSALVHSGPKTQVFRQRAGYWKAIDVVTLSQQTSELTVSSQELRRGDALAIRGLGFLKIVEQSISAPMSDSHVH